MNTLAYIRGVMDGDGSVNRGNQNRPNRGLGKPRIELNTISKKFADSFADALTKCALTPRCYEGNNQVAFNGYIWTNHFYRVFATCNESFLSKIATLHVENKESGISYLIGFFESEGHFHIKKYSKRECWAWRITNKDLTKLERAKRILFLLGVKSTIYGYPKIIPFLQIQKRSDIKYLQSLGMMKK